MNPYQLNTPVVLFFFNREKTTLKVIDEIRKARPSKLYLVGEGHRPDRLGEKEVVENLRALVEKSIDWPCEVKKNYVPEDIGAGLRISSGISWVFEHEDEAIFLEDDIIPSQSFFRFSEEMLNFYRDNTKVMAICGHNPIPHYPIQGDYTFSNVAHIWGWATWKRAWQGYDYQMKEWPEYKANRTFKRHFPNPVFYKFRCDEFDLAAQGITHTWDYQFSFHLLKHQGLAVVPKINMISNVGIGPDATNTKHEFHVIQGEAKEINFPIAFKDEIDYDFNFDNAYFKEVLLKPYYHSLWFRIKYRMKMFLPKRAQEKLRKVLKK
jgi:hypothetical protein